MAQIIRVTSEALQSTIRRLLPSQQGFGEDLQASNVIQPIIDLTPTAEGSEVRADLQTALAYGSQTSFNVSNTTTDLISNTGFYRVFGVANTEASTAGLRESTFRFSGSLGVKVIWSLQRDGSSNDSQVSVPFDFVVFMDAGDTFQGLTNAGSATLVGSTRQIADINGVLVNPAGFNPQ